MENENKNLTDFLNYNASYKDIYLMNNKELSNEKNVALDTLFSCISNDMDFIMNNIGVSPNKFGYAYWKDAVFIFMLSGKMHVSICKDIYPQVAKKYNKSPMSVERAMRLCFETSLLYSNTNGSNYVLEYFRNYLLNPQNSQLIVKFMEIVTSKEFQKLKYNQLNSFNK